jgi:hypothetical protein
MRKTEYTIRTYPAIRETNFATIPVMVFFNAGFSIRLTVRYVSNEMITISPHTHGTIEIGEKFRKELVRATRKRARKFLNEQEF